MTDMANGAMQRSGQRVDPYILRGGRLRLSQVITTFGPGAVMDLPSESIMVAGLDDWPEGERIQDPRLESSLRQEGFYAPVLLEQRSSGGLPCVRFPRQLICAGCGFFTRKKTCPSCGRRAYPARLITICPAGHADDFPWIWWVHRKGDCTGTPLLKLDSQQKTAALSDLVIRCETCKQSRSLAGALGPTALGGLRCTGRRPWLIGSDQEECHEKPRSVLRGATNVYFSSTFSALSIPPWSDPIQVLLNKHWTTLRDLNPTVLQSVIEQLNDFTGYTPGDVMLAVDLRRRNTTTVGNLRREEYLAFRNPGRGFDRPVADFQIRSEAVPEPFQDTIARVILATRLREVIVLRGFTRIDPPDSENIEQRLAPIARQDQSWLPAVEHRGEGIFVELLEQRVKVWEDRPAVQERMRTLNLAAATWREQRNLPPVPGVAPRGVLLHTLAHLLMRQLSLECGYSSSALRERIYTGPDMCGLLVYTASADADGSLGGLVQQGLKERFVLTLQAMLEHARWCSADPLCTEHDPTRTGKLNGASCHVCSLVAETSCERANRFLDRAFLMDLPGLAARTGYFES